MGLKRSTEDMGVSDAEWEERIRIACSAPDNRWIPRVPEAGEKRDGYLVMHNGTRIAPFSYYGEGIFRLLLRNRGVHEPQEERVFQEVLKQLPKRPVMLELGSYWGFYSLWLLAERPSARCFLAEPFRRNLVSGKLNFRLNQKKGKFIRAYCGRRPEGIDDSVPNLKVDDFLENRGISHLDILHSDIQGSEDLMLKQAARSLSGYRIGTLFISTHWDEVHQECKSLLLDRGYLIVAESTIQQSYSHDGLIVARSPKIKGPKSYPISLRGEND